jgi:hypothetical protein
VTVFAIAVLGMVNAVGPSTMTSLAADVAIFYGPRSTDTNERQLPVPSVSCSCFCSFLSPLDILYFSVYFHCSTSPSSLWPGREPPLSHAVSVLTLIPPSPISPDKFLPRPTCSYIKPNLFARGLLNDLMMKAIRISETSVTLYKTTRRNIPEGSCLQTVVRFLAMLAANGRFNKIFQYSPVRGRSYLPCDKVCSREE